MHHPSSTSRPFVDVASAPSAIDAAVAGRLPASRTRPVRHMTPGPFRRLVPPAGQKSIPPTEPPIVVLVVDDEPLTGQVLKRMLLGSPGFRLYHCADAAAARELAKEICPTVILQDFQMPELDGIAMVKAFRADPATRDVPLVLLSSEEEPAVKAAAFAAGADDYLVKFPDRVEMLARLHHHARSYAGNLARQEQVWQLEDSKIKLAEEGRFVRETFGRYLSEAVVERLLDSPEGLRLGGETRKVTILMSDLRGFTSMSERLPPADMMRVVNNYLTVMTEIVVRHGGTIDEFIGDAILAIFGAPVQRDDDAARAVACALDMQRAMVEVNAKNRAAGLPEVAMGIGLNTGEVVVGNIGSSQRAKYGVVGSAVNVTARIESYTLGGHVIISQSTLDEAGEVAVVEEQREVLPKGLAQPIQIYRLRY
jgi:adenylate cyclase